MAEFAPFRLPDTPARSDLVAKYFRALGDPTRLRILGLLQAEGELSAGALTRRLGQPQPKVSNHLACLRWCGFVATRRQHRVIYYQLADQRSRPCWSWPRACWTITPTMWPPAAASPTPD
jgi:ArsR family transcriptional regulator, cadmium/lead-responsive transcriptional repressor